MALLLSGPALGEAPLAPWELPRGQARSQSVGKANGGHLTRGVELPQSGPGYIRRVSKKRRHFGTDETVHLLQYLGRRLIEAYPHSAPFFVGDISKKGGGRVPPHGSHRSGRDVDIGFFEKGNEERRRFNGAMGVDAIDIEKTWFLIETLLLTAQVQYVFINERLLPAFRAHARSVGWEAADLDRFFLMGSKGGRRGAIRHAAGHTYHFHVRFKCPSRSRRCVN